MDVLRAPYTDWALAAALIWHLRTILWINLCCFLLVLVATFHHKDAPSLLAVLGSSFAAGAVLFLALVPRKLRARRACSIVFLRGFQQEARADVPNRVLPCIGCYGRILWLRNIVKVVPQDVIGMLRGEMMTDTLEQPQLRETWPVELWKLLPRADLAVIDISVLSGSLFWEIEQCLKLMPPRRMVLIAELSHHAGANFKRLCRRFPALLDTPSPVPIYPSRYVIPLNVWKWWFFQYERRMHRCMKMIAAQDPVSRRSDYVMDQGLQFQKERYPVDKHEGTS